MFRVYITLFFFVAIFSSAAQIGSARMYVSLHFEGGSSIHVADQNIALNFNDVNDFSEGVRTPLLNNHLQVTSRGAYEVWVKSQQNVFTSANQLTTLPVNIVKIDAINSYGSGSVYLDSQPNLLISNPSRLLGENIDVTYHIPSNKTHLLFNQVESNFQTVITYTLILK